VVSPFPLRQRRRPPAAILGRLADDSTWDHWQGLGWIAIILWAICAAADDEIVPQILDRYHVRTITARELAVDGVSEKDVPRTTYAEGPLP